ncbi:hypothetical protein ACFQX7_26920 [Luedemannella flava]
MGVLGFWQFASTTLLEPSGSCAPPMEVLRLGCSTAKRASSAGRPVVDNRGARRPRGLHGVGVSLGLLMSQARWVEISICRAVLLQTIRSSRSCRSWATGSAAHPSWVTVCVLVSLFPIITSTRSREVGRAWPARPAGAYWPGGGSACCGCRCPPRCLR